MSKPVADKIIFRKQDSIGVNDALDDSEFLHNCFIDLGDIKTIEDFSDPRCLIIGRTGVGKTALLSELRERKGARVIVVDAESLAMNYISNSSIVNGLMELGIDLNTFFKYLWRHVIYVENH
jgi:Cdc6-like AAA superfamily ATPase